MGKLIPSNVGYKPLNPYQCRLNYHKAAPCPPCNNDAPVCKIVSDGPIEGVVIGFKHESLVSDDCITVTEGVNDVVLLPAPIDTAAEGYTTKQLQDAIFQTLKKYPLPAGLTSNPDLSTFILECETVLSITDEGLEQYASSGLISLVLEGGEEIALKKVCDKRTECKYQYQGNGVTAAAVEAALVAKEIEVLSVKETVLDAENGYAMVTAEVVGEVPADCVVEGAAPQHCGCCEAFYDPEAKGEEEVEGQKAISQMNVAELKEECNKKGIELQGNENKQALKDLLKED